MTSDPRFKTQPYAHQLDAFNRYVDRPWFGLFFEQRCGKTLTTLIIAAEKYRRGEIDSLLIIAPNGVHRNWTNDEIPQHLPEDTRYRCLLWRSGHMASKTAQAAVEKFLVHGGLRVLAVNVDALTTTGFRELATRFFKGRRVMVVVDESSDISNGSAKRTQMALKIARHRGAVVRAVLDGTPVAAGPLGLYSQCEFLDPIALGFRSYYAFRARYAEMEDIVVGRDPHGNDRTAKVVKRFINVEELQQKLTRFSMRVLRSDCADLPPKIYQKFYFDLSPTARRHYDELRTAYLTELKSGTVVTAAMVLTRYLRLQQVSSGFLPSERPLVACPACDGRDAECLACEGVGLLPDPNAPALEPLGENPRLEALARAVAPLTGQCIIWCKFTYDVDAVVRWATAAGGGVVRYDGATDAAGRAAALSAFQGGGARWFVGTASAAGRGLDLSAADAVVYYSHSWSLRQRLQSEDRAQSLKRKTSVLYIDLVASETIDEKIVDALRNGRRLSDMITGDKPEDWL